MCPLCKTNCFIPLLFFSFHSSFSSIHFFFSATTPKKAPPFSPIEYHSFVMLPDSGPPTPEPIFHHKKPKSSDYTPSANSAQNKNPLYSIHIFISAHPRTWILVSILFLQIFFLFMARSLPHSITHLSPTPSPAIQIQLSPCKYGKVFVYDLPPMFNKELYDKCDELNPWNSRCDALSNNGLGRRAVEIGGVVPENLTHTWYWTDQFASELIFHNRMLGHTCRTLDPDSASAFYIPFYGGLAVGKYLWSSNYTARDRDFHCENMLKWVQDQPYWNRSNGWDHFMMLGRISWDFRRSKDEDWGSSCIYMPTMKTVTRLLIERNPWDYFDVGVPYPTGFHPKTDSDVSTWQNFVRKRNRTTLFSFAGATRGTIKDDFRGLLLRHCLTQTTTCRVVDCGGSRCANGSTAILETFLDSDFCLQPRGDSFTRRSIFDCMIAGSIPVFFWRRTAYYQYEWFLPIEPESYSVFIDRREVKNGTSIVEILQQFKPEQVRKMREKVIEYIPKLVYAEPKEGLENVRDAFDVAIEGVLRRFKQGYRWK